MEERRLRPRRRTGLLALGIALLVLIGLLAAVTWLPLQSARAEWRKGRVAEAIASAERWMRLQMWRNQYHQLLAAAYLTSNNQNAAQSHLNAVRDKRLWLSAVSKQEVANQLFINGRYEAFLAYDNAVHTLRESDDVALYRAAALTGAGKVSEAETVVRAVDRDDVDPQKLASLERALSHRKEGSYPFVVDRDGKTIAAYQIENRDVVAVNTDFAAFVEKEAGQRTIESLADRIGTNDVIETTLDSAVQKAAVRAMSGFRGAFVAIDPRTNEILALASNSGRDSISNLAVEHQYEPGSVIKVLTGMAARSYGVNVESLFPYTCEGALPIDGRRFGDWAKGGHGLLQDFDEAMAQSCNVVFADLGVRIGADRLRQFMNRAGFDRTANLTLFTIPLGSTVGQLYNKFETAFYAIGLEHQTSSTLHLAMIAAMIANRGVITTPQLVRSRRSILGETVKTEIKPQSERVVSADIAERMVRSMMAVVRRDRGTGRRAAIEGVSLALKTGTAGKEEQGYQAVIIAFAPAEQPKIAFALVAEQAGPAEFAAAKVAHDFLAAIRPRL